MILKKTNKKIKFYIILRIPNFIFLKIEFLKIKIINREILKLLKAKLREKI
jgi:hypothetical protein